MDIHEWKYNGAFTREQFLFHEMRTTARLMEEKLSEDQIIDKIAAENLFQYNTERSIKRMAKLCVFRLKNMGSDALISAIATKSSETARQICLYAMMKQFRIVWEFMILVIGEKYRSLQLNFNRAEMNAFYDQLIEHNEIVAGWSESTIAKQKQILMKLLVDNGYLDTAKAEKISPVLISGILAQEIRNNGDEMALVAFNCLG